MTRVLRPSTLRILDPVYGHILYYRAVLREGSKVVWECIHHHGNRDWDGNRRGQCASNCASAALRELEARGEAQRFVKPLPIVSPPPIVSFDQDAELPF